MAKKEKTVGATGADLVEARVLVDCQYGKCNEVVTLTPEEIQQGEKDGCLDSNPDAVAAAKG